MMNIIKYTLAKAAYFECLLHMRIKIAAHPSIEEAFGFN